MNKILQLLDITALDHRSCTNTVHRSLVINVPNSIIKLDWHLGLHISMWRPSQSLALPMVRNIHLMFSLNYKTSFSHVIALYKVLLPSWHLLPTSSITSNHASSVLILVGKMSLYHLLAVRQVWPWLTFCVLLQPEILLESQIPGLHTISSEGPPTPSYNEATSQMKHLRNTFAFFFIAACLQAVLCFDLG